MWGRNVYGFDVPPRTGRVQLGRGQPTPADLDGRSFFTRCYFPHVAPQNAETKVVADVAPDGTVITARGAGPNPSFNTCVADLVRGWRFQPTEGPTRFELPIRLDTTLTSTTVEVQ